MIDRATVQRILDATNIVDVVSEYVTLRKSGANYKGLCPFHDDKTPSFYVSPSRGICHCFSCGKGGNSVNFLMEHNQMSYVEALRWLAKKYNIEIRERELTDEEKRQESEREAMFIVNEWAGNYFQDILHNDEDGTAIGLQYFRQRGFRDDIISKFQLGYDPVDRHRLAMEATGKGYNLDILTKSGVLYKNDHGEYIDRFAGRVIFPWIDKSGRVVGFTGRVLDSRTKGVNQKYVNSPDSEIYHKSNELYGIYQAKKAIHKNDKVYLVEGQADVISMHQCGIENVVAGSGTALSRQQIVSLCRFTRNITLIYDDDEAGHKAALKGTDEILSQGMNLKILLFPSGMDPDEYARTHSAEEMQLYIGSNEMDFVKFKSNLLLSGVTDPVKRSEAISSVVQSVAMIPDQIVRATYIHECSQHFGISEATLISQMNRFIRQGKDEQLKMDERNRQLGGESSASPVQLGFVDTNDKGAKIEEMLIRLVVRYGEQLITVQDIDGNDISLPLAQYVDIDLGGDGLKFNNESYNKILAEAVSHIEDEGFKTEPYFIQHPDIEISQLAARLCVDHYQLAKSLKVDVTMEKLREQTLRLVLNFRLNFVEGYLSQLKDQMVSQKGNDEKIMENINEYNRMIKIRNQLAKKLGNELIL